MEIVGKVLRVRQLQQSLQDLVTTAVTLDSSNDSKNTLTCQELTAASQEANS